jgi:exodeoxyribonuclease VII small subunit
VSKSKPKSGERGEEPGPSFEDALAQVESIIEQIESGEVGLEESLSAYERGVGLINLCRDRLDKAQQRVEDLTKKLGEADDAEPADD